MKGNSVSNRCEEKAVAPTFLLASWCYGSPLIEKGPRDLSYDMSVDTYINLNKSQLIWRGKIGSNLDRRVGKQSLEKLDGLTQIYTSPVNFNSTKGSIEPESLS